MIFTVEARDSRTKLRINNKDYLKWAAAAIYLWVRTGSMTLLRGAYRVRLYRLCVAEPIKPSYITFFICLYCALRPTRNYNLVGYYSKRDYCSRFLPTGPHYPYRNSHNLVAA